MTAHMLLPLPYYRNDGDGYQCMQVAMKIVLKHFLKKDYSLADLDRITGRKEGGYNTFTQQIAPALYDLGLDVTYYTSGNPPEWLQGEDYIRAQWADEADKMLKVIDVQSMVAATRRLLDYAIWERKHLTIEEIEEALRQGHVPMALVDYHKIMPRYGRYKGHFIVLTGYDEKHITFHEPGPRYAAPNKKIEKGVFMTAWSAKGTDNDIIIVRGKR